MEEICGMVGSGSCVEEGQGDCGDDDIEAKFYRSTACILSQAERSCTCMLTTSLKEPK
jgi:hypothetical protein